MKTIETIIGKRKISAHEAVLNKFAVCCCFIWTSQEASDALMKPTSVEILFRKLTMLKRA
jgi:hypothetical protein